MGKNKLAKFDDMAGYPHVFQYPFAALQEKGFDMKGQWHERFFKNDHPIVLELGCGKGEYTVGLGKLFPNKNFIGVDIKGARMWTGAKRIAGNRDEERGFPTYEYRIDFLFLRSRRSSRDLDHISRPSNEKGQQASDRNPFYENVSGNPFRRWYYPFKNGQ